MMQSTTALDSLRGVGDGVMVAQVVLVKGKAPAMAGMAGLLLAASPSCA